MNKKKKKKLQIISALYFFFSKRFFINYDSVLQVLDFMNFGARAIFKERNFVQLFIKVSEPFGVSFIMRDQTNK